MVDEERIKELEQLDKRLERRRRLTVVFFVFLSVALVLYALSIEMKIDRLSEEPAVVVYNDASAEEHSNRVVESQISEYVAFNLEDTTVNADVENDVVTESMTGDNIKDDKETDDSEQVYYVTASGKKYHKSGCSYLNKTRIEVTPAEITAGGYTACSRCFKE